jgi:phage gpG-like protein
MPTITIKITGDKECVDVLKKISEEIKNPIVPLDTSSRKYMNYISANFLDEGKTFNKPWKPLSEATIAIKRALRKKGQSIGVEKPLLRTGLLRKSFDYKLQGNKESSIFNKTDYASIHQEGGTVLFRGQSRRVPKRTLAEVDDNRIKMVASTFEYWVYSLIRKYKAD